MYAVREEHFFHSPIEAIPDEIPLQLVAIGHFFLDRIAFEAAKQSATKRLARSAEWRNIVSRLEEFRTLLQKPVAQLTTEDIAMPLDVLVQLVSEFLGGELAIRLPSDIGEWEDLMSESLRNNDGGDSEDPGNNEPTVGVSFTQCFVAQRIFSVMKDCKAPSLKFHELDIDRVITRLGVLQKIYGQLPEADEILKPVPINVEALPSIVRGLIGIRVFISVQGVLRSIEGLTKDEENKLYVFLREKSVDASTVKTATFKKLVTVLKKHIVLKMEIYENSLGAELGDYMPHAGKEAAKPS